MVEKRTFESLGHADHGWLNARHHFSFANYYDPARMGWGAIRVWNDDEIAPNSGFPPHPHRDMEIITYVRKGAITHKDSMGNTGRTEAGDVQVMSAGAGVQHSEWNADDETCQLFQIWILPREQGGQPGWGTRQFPKGDRSGKWTVFAAKDGEDDALPLKQDARVMGATLCSGDTLDYQVAPGRHGYLVLAAGSISLNGQVLKARDGAAITGAETLSLKSIEDAEIVFVDTI